MRDSDIENELEGVTRLEGVNVSISLNNLIVEFEDYGVRLEGLRLKRRIVKAVDGVSLGVRKGEILALVGESGSGKTTLGRTIVGLTKPTHGEVYVEGELIDYEDKESLKRLWRKAQMVFQDPYSTFNPLERVTDAVKKPLIKLVGIRSESEIESRLRDVLNNVGLDYSQIVGKYPNQLSGGQRQRAAIARALISNPSIIVADEPVSMLDVSLRAGILNLLKKINKENGVTIIFITHDLAVASYIGDKVAVMYRGRVVEFGPVKDVMFSPYHPYTNLLISSIPTLSGHGEWLERKDLTKSSDQGRISGCRFYPRCPFRTDACKDTEPTLIEIEKGRKLACYNPIRSP